MGEKKQAKNRASYAMTLGRRTARLGNGWVGIAHAPGRYPALLAEAALLGACEAGMDVIDLGEATRPVFQFGLGLASCRCGIYVGGGEVPVLQTVGELGLPLSRLEERLLHSSQEDAAAAFPGRREKIPGLWDLYCSRLQQVAGKSLQGSRCILRCGDPILQQQARGVLSGLGCQLLDGPVLWLNNTGERLAAFTPKGVIIPFPQLVQRACEICFGRGEEVALPEGMLTDIRQGRIRRYSLRPQTITPPQRAARELAAQQLWERDGLMLAILLLKHQKQGSLDLDEKQKMWKGAAMDFPAQS